MQSSDTGLVPGLLQEQVARHEHRSRPDGQQLLEHCRREQLLAPAAVFLMVTAERGYDRVMSAAEMAPDDYLVKPFTEETLRLRLTRAIGRKHALAAIQELRARGEHAALIAACERQSTVDPQHASELGRMKADALLALGRYREACDEFERLVAAHAAPWARLGMARALPHRRPPRRMVDRGGHAGAGGGLVLRRDQRGVADDRDLADEQVDFADPESTGDLTDQILDWEHRYQFRPVCGQTSRTAITRLHQTRRLYTARRVAHRPRSPGAAGARSPTAARCPALR